MGIIEIQLSHNVKYIIMLAMEYLKIEVSKLRELYSMRTHFITTLYLVLILVVAAITILFSIITLLSMI